MWYRVLLITLHTGDTLHAKSPSRAVMLTVKIYLRPISPYFFFSSILLVQAADAAG